MRGRYVALEGVEGSGKSTVSALVASEIRRRGIESVLVREPGGTPLGEEIRAMLLHAGGMTAWAEAALFAAQRAQLASQVIRPALGRGAWVVSDRSYYSSLAYQGAGRALGIEAVRRLNETVLDGVEPDVVVVLDIDPAEGLGRQLALDRIGGAGLALQREAAEAYHLLADSEPDRVVLVSPDGPPAEVARRVMAAVEAVGV